MSPLYQSADEVPENVKREMIEGIVVLGKKLRDFREFAHLASVTARYGTGERTMVEITCDGENRLWVVDPPGAEPLEITPLVDKP